MATTVVKTIKSGGDYTTLQTHEDASPANLVTADQIWQGQASGTFTVAGALLVVAGSTVDSTRYYELTTEAGAAYNDNANVQTNRFAFVAANGCSITDTSSYTIPITINQEYCRLSNLQVSATGTSGSSYSIYSQLASGSANLLIDRCIIENFRSSAAFLFGSNEIIRNSLIVQRGSGRGSIASIQNGAQAYNCTFASVGIASATVGIIGAYGAATIKNCVITGCVSVHSGTAPNYTTCVTNVASPPSGCTTVAHSTANYVQNQGPTYDYRLPLGSGAIDVGTTDATNGAFDAAWTARPQGSAYDVGAWERVVSAALAKQSRFVRQAVNRAATY